MRARNIIRQLTEKNILTDFARNSLIEQQDNPLLFLKALIEIYEDKAAKYLTSCHSRVKRKLLNDNSCPAGQVDAKALEECIHFAYNVTFVRDKAFLIFSLMLLLNDTAPDLTISLGLKTLFDSRENLSQVAKKVFIHFFARCRLFSEIEADDLQAICTEVLPQDAEIFPIYLFNALLLQAQFSLTIQQSLIAIPESSRAASLPNILAGHTQSEARLIASALTGLIYYCGTILDGYAFDADLFFTYFRHTRSSQNLTMFSESLASGYIQEMRNPNKCAEIYAESLRLLNSASGQICLPALSLLDIHVDLNFDDISEYSARCQRHLDQVIGSRAQIEEATRRGREQAHQRIDQLRANVQLPEIRFGIQIGIPGGSGNAPLGMPFNLR